ncbi:MAG: hypothetical protein PHY47_19415 [Lachnospiraceae bacterium]|nr:hypothetical protein [Lachnospiraceae bacterium]
MNDLILSSLGHTWILDLDGTLVKHNGYLMDGKDELLEGTSLFLSKIPVDDMIIIITSRIEEYREITENFLNSKGIRYNHIIFGAPYGERIILNDDKPSGLQMSYGISKQRDSREFPSVVINDNV